jgi:hypothetical protein
MLVYGHDGALAEWVARQLGCTFAPPYTCIGIMRADVLIAACLYNNFEPPNIQMTIASVTPRWASHQVIGRLFAYPFLELGCRRITAVTGSNNTRARMFLSRLGFRLEGIHPELFEHDDGVSYGLLRRDAQKWLESHDVKSTQAAGSPGSLHDGIGGIEGQHRERHRQCEAG